MQLIVPFLITATICIAWKLLVHHLVISYICARQIPTLQPATPFLGHVKFFMRKNLQQVFSALVKFFERVDRVAKLQIGPLPIFLVNHPDWVQELMNRTELYDKPIFYEHVGLGKGMASERCGRTWRWSRKLLNPTFNTKILNEFIPIMDARATRMVRKLDVVVEEEAELDILPVVSQCTLEMVFSTTMGCKMEEREGEKEYIKCLEKSMDSLGERMMNVEKYFHPFYKLSKAYRTGEACRIFCNAFSDKIIQERKHEMSKDAGFRAQLHSSDGIQAKTLNFLDQILTIKKPDGNSFSDSEISDHIYTVIAGGNETSALITSYACVNLAMDNTIQSKVVDEINQVFHSPTVEVTHDTLKQLVYLEMVIKETLRLYPALPFLARSNATSIELDGVRIPKDQIICFSLYNLHRRKDIWGDDVERFDPERFRPELAKERHPYAYLPFSGGQRNCIGGRYAMMSLKIMLLRILQNFEISTRLKRDDLQLRWALSLKLVGPHAVRFKKRDLCR